MFGDGLLGEHQHGRVIIAQALTIFIRRALLGVARLDVADSRFEFSLVT